MMILGCPFDLYRLVRFTALYISMEKMLESWEKKLTMYGESFKTRQLYDQNIIP